MNEQFEIGQRVSDLDDERPGVVIEKGSKDYFGNFTRYRVACDDGSTKWRNSTNLKEI